VAALGGLAAGTLINRGYQVVTDLTIGDDWASMDENSDSICVLSWRDNSLTFRTAGGRESEKS
jgi:hypothetical protein